MGPSREYCFIAGSRPPTPQQAVAARAGAGRQLLTRRRLAPRLSVWPPLPPDLYLRRPRRRLPFPLEEPSYRLLGWARHGIWHGVRALGLEPGDELLVPAYHHGSEVEALLRAGVSCRFYDCDQSLAPHAEALDELLAPAVRGLYLIHYAGLPQDAERWRRWCRERDLLLIEDAAQAWPGTVAGRPVGSFGDLAIFCLYKTFGLSEGAAVICPRRPEGLPRIPMDPRLGLGELAVQHGFWLAGRSGLLYAAVRRRRAAPPYDPERDFDLRDPAVGPWRTTPFVLRRAWEPDVAERRRRNYRALLEGLRHLVPPAFARLPEGASPFMFPIEVDGKAEVAAGLRRHGIVALDFWAVPHPSLPVADFPDAAARRASTIGLPVHQELRGSDLERILAAVREWTGGGRGAAGGRL